jgi:hypothetical protein
MRMIDEDEEDEDEDEEDAGRHIRMHTDDISYETA